MEERTRLTITVALGLGFVVWQASRGPARAFGAILAVSALGYALAPIVREGVV